MSELWFYCTEKDRCNWPGYVLFHGYEQGSIPSKSEPWRQRHDKECKGTLIQCEMVVQDPQPEKK